MKVLVPVKRVADPNNANKVQISADGKEVTSAGLEGKMNPFDEWSLEAALRLTENAAEKKRVGEVVLVSIGDKECVQTLRQGMAMGAESSILVDSNDGALDSTVVANVLAKIVEKVTPDVVFLGKQSADGDSNVAGTKLAEILGWPLVNYATEIHTDDDGKSFTIKRELDTGVQTIKVQSPCVLTSSDRILRPEAIKNGVTPADHKYPEMEGGRYAPLKGIMQAKKKPLEELALADLGASAELAVNYTKFELPPARSGQTTFVESVEELVTKLKTEAKVLS